MNGSVKLWTSLFGSQITATGGIIATISGVLQYGWWFLWAPCSFIAGLLLFRHHMLKVSAARPEVGYLTSRLRGSSPRFRHAFYGSMIFVQTFIVGWIFYILSTIYSNFYADIPSVANLAPLMALTVALCGAYYVSRGGWNRAAKTDQFQSFAILFVVGLWMFQIVSGWNEALFVEPNWSVESRLPLSSLLLFAVTVSLANVMFAFADASNWHVANRANDKCSLVFIVGCIACALFFACMFVVPISVRGDNPYLLLSRETWSGILVVALLPVFTWSTIDTKCVALGRLIDTEFLEPLELDPETHDFVRRCFPFAFVLGAVLIAFFLIGVNPDFFTSLVACASCLIVFVPRILAGDGRECRVDLGPTYAATFGVMVFVSLALLWVAPQWAVVPALFGFVMMYIIDRSSSIGREHD